MSQGISQDEANALRARIADALKDEPRGSPKRASVSKAFGQSNFSSFMKGARGASSLAVSRVTAALEGRSAPTSGRKGRVYQYAPPDEVKALRANVMKQIGEGGPYRSLSHFLLEAMGLGHKQQSHMFSIISGRRVMTVDAAAKITAAVDGKPTASAPKRSRALIVAPKTEPRAERASRDELASLRLDVGHVLATRFGGSAPAMARELGITAARLAKFLDGGTLTTDVTSDITRRLAALGTLRPTALLSTIRGAAISIEAWRDGSVQGELEPPELRARKLVEKWGTEAIAMVLQLAGGGAA